MPEQFGFDFLQTVESVPIKKEKRTTREYEITCIVCSSVFIAGSSRAKYCCKDCRKTAQKIRRDAEKQQDKTVSATVDIPRSRATADVNVSAEVLKQIVENQQSQIEQLREMITLQQSMLDAMMQQRTLPAAQHHTTHHHGPRAMQTMPKVTQLTFNGPAYDDEPLQVSVKKVAADKQANSGQNFLNSLKALQG